MLGWNIRAGGGRRVQSIQRQILDWDPDIIVLSEFRGTAPGEWLAGQLLARGYRHQRRAAGAPEDRQNQVFVASRFPLRRANPACAPTEPGRWLMVNVLGPLPIALGVMHIPNQVTGRKPAYHQAVLEVARQRRSRPGLLIGDTNSGRIELDEQSPVFNARTDQWFRDLSRLGWADAFRLKRGAAREYTWYSPNRGNGFRLDQAFVNKPLHDRLIDASHHWGLAPPFPCRREALSDHAALIVDLRIRNDPGRSGGARPALEPS